MLSLLKNSFKAFVFTSVFVFITTLLNAQPNPGPGNQGNGTKTTNDGPQVPFDGGMSLVLAASGISYAAKKLKGLKRSFG
jgi:hypothetical protein